MEESVNQKKASSKESNLSIFSSGSNSEPRRKFLWRRRNYYSLLNLRTIYDDNGFETKKLVKIELGEDAILNNPVDSGSPISFLKKNVVYEIKLRDPQLKFLPVDKKEPCSSLRLH